MDMRNLKPIQQFAMQFGMKAVVYGGPGSGKTPICIKTAPRPIVLASEPGFLSVRDSTAPGWYANTTARLTEFMDWFLKSREADNFDTLIWDSTSESADQYLDEKSGGTSAAGNKQHGQLLYGDMANFMMPHINKLYYMQNKHIILIAHQTHLSINGINYARPTWPGKVLPVKVIHRFDVITQLGKWQIPGQPPNTPAFRTQESFERMGRDRSGNFAEYEPANVSALIAKFMA